MDTLDITEAIRIPLTEISMTAVRSRGAGGQNVNKLATAIHLQFDFDKSEAVPETVKARLRDFPDRRVTRHGTIVIKSMAYRSQERNRRAALTRLTELLRRAARTPKRRIPVGRNRAANERRLKDKSRRSELKRSRRRLPDDFR